MLLKAVGTTEPVTNENREGLPKVYADKPAGDRHAACTKVENQNKRALQVLETALNME